VLGKCQKVLPQLQNTEGEEMMDEELLKVIGATVDTINQNSEKLVETSRETSRVLFNFVSQATCKILELERRIAMLEGRN
jgi:hypothetical protein